MMLLYYYHKISGKLIICWESDTPPLPGQPGENQSVIKIIDALVSGCIAAYCGA